MAKKKKTTIPKEKWGVHESHCCHKHGCKYGNEECPVALGLTKQTYSQCGVGFDLNDDCVIRTWNDIHIEYMSIPLNKRPDFFKWLKKNYWVPKPKSDGNNSNP